MDPKAELRWRTHAPKLVERYPRGDERHTVQEVYPPADKRYATVRERVRATHGQLAEHLGLTVSDVLDLEHGRASCDVAQYTERAQGLKRA